MLNLLPSIAVAIILTSPLSAIPATPTKWIQLSEENNSQNLKSDPLEDGRQVAPFALVLSEEEANEIERGTEQIYRAWQAFLNDILFADEPKIFNANLEFPSKAELSHFILDNLRQIGYGNIERLRQLFKKHTSIENIHKQRLNLVKIDGRWRILPQAAIDIAFDEAILNEKFLQALGPSRTNFTSRLGDITPIVHRLKERVSKEGKAYATCWEARKYKDLFSSFNELFEKNLGLDQDFFLKNKLKEVGFELFDPASFENWHLLSNCATIYPYDSYPLWLSQWLSNFEEDDELLFPQQSIFWPWLWLKFSPLFISFYLKEEPIFEFLDPIEIKESILTQEAKELAFCNTTACSKIKDIQNHPILRRSLATKEKNQKAASSSDKERQRLIPDNFLLDFAGLEYFKPNSASPVSYKFIVRTSLQKFNYAKSFHLTGATGSTLDERKGFFINSSSFPMYLPVLVAKDNLWEDKNNDTSSSLVEESQTSDALPHFPTTTTADFSYLSDYPLGDHVRAYPLPLIYPDASLTNLTMESAKINKILVHFFADVFLGTQQVVQEGIFSQEELKHMWGHLRKDFSYEDTREYWKNKSLDHIFYATALDVMQGEDGRFYLIEVNSNSCMNPGGMADHVLFQNQFCERFHAPKGEIKTGLPTNLIQSFLTAQRVTSKDEQVAIIIYDNLEKIVNATEDMYSLEGYFQYQEIKKLGFVNIINPADLSSMDAMQAFLDKKYKYIINIDDPEFSLGTEMLYQYFAQNKDVYLLFPPGIHELDNKALMAHMDDLAQLYGIDLDTKYFVIPKTSHCSTQDDITSCIQAGDKVIKSTYSGQGLGVLMPNCAMTEKTKGIAGLFFYNELFIKRLDCIQDCCEKPYAVISQECVKDFKLRPYKNSFEKLAFVLRTFPWYDGKEFHAWPHVFGRISQSSFESKVNVYGGALEMLVIPESLEKEAFYKESI